VWKKRGVVMLPVGMNVPGICARALDARRNERTSKSAVRDALILLQFGIISPPVNYRPDISFCVALVLDLAFAITVNRKERMPKDKVPNRASERLTITTSRPKMNSAEDTRIFHFVKR
jgi:hypothetical protein